MRLNGRWRRGCVPGPRPADRADDVSIHTGTTNSLEGLAAETCTPGERRRQTDEVRDGCEEGTITNV